MTKREPPHRRHGSPNHPRRAPKPPRAPRRPSQPASNVVGPQRPGDEERIAVRRVKALNLRMTGEPYRAIAQHLKVDVHTVWDDVQAELTALRAVASQTAEEVRELELRRLDAALKGLWPKIRKGDVDAARALVRIQERRARLLGLDVPTDATGRLSVEDVVTLVTALTASVRAEILSTIPDRDRAQVLLIAIQGHVSRLLELPRLATEAAPIAGETIDATPVEEPTS